MHWPRHSTSPQASAMYRATCLDKLTFKLGQSESCPVTPSQILATQDYSDRNRRKCERRHQAPKSVSHSRLAERQCMYTLESVRTLLQDQRSLCSPCVRFDVPLRVFVRYEFWTLVWWAILFRCAVEIVESLVDYVWLILRQVQKVSIC